MTALSRLRLGAAVVVVALALSGCASSPALTETAASELQQDVFAVTNAAKGGDVTAALAALDEATAELEAAYARGDVTKDRRDLIRAAIAAVRAKLEGTAQSTSGSTGTTAPTTTNPKPRSSTGTGTDDADEDAPVMTPAPGTNGTTAPKPSATPSPTATAATPPATPTPTESVPSDTPTTPTDGGEEDGGNNEEGDENPLPAVPEGLTDNSTTETVAQPTQ